ncbi:hypothetical protein YC2023_021746 [Brassica napus]
MEFWGAKVKAGQTLKVKPGENCLIHISQASLGKAKKGVFGLLYATVDDKKLLLGTLSQDSFPHINFDHLLFDREFELSHTLERGYVHFIGHQRNKKKRANESSKTPVSFNTGKSVLQPCSESKTNQKKQKIQKENSEEIKEMNKSIKELSEAVKTLQQIILTKANLPEEKETPKKKEEDSCCFGCEEATGNNEQTIFVKGFENLRPRAEIKNALRFAFIDLRKGEGNEKALELNGSYMGGKELEEAIEDMDEEQRKKEQAEEKKTEMGLTEDDEDVVVPVYREETVVTPEEKKQEDESKDDDDDDVSSLVCSFTGVEVKAGKPLKVKPDEDCLIHLSQASLDKGKKGEAALLYVTVDGKKLVIGTLVQDTIPQISFDLVFEKEFELSHSSKGSVHFIGYKSPNIDEEEDFPSDSEEEEEEVEVPATSTVTTTNGAAPASSVVTVDSKPKAKAAAAAKPAEVKPESDEDDDESDEEDDSEDDGSDSEKGMDVDEDDSEDEEDDSEEEEDTPKKPEPINKKRPIESATPVSAKKAKPAATPQKTVEKYNDIKEEKKKGGHTATPHPAKKGGKSPMNANQSPKSGGQSSGSGGNKKPFNNSGKQFGSNNKGNKGKGGKGRA